MTTPLLVLIVKTYATARNKYHDGLIIDPGHKRIRHYDKMVVLSVWLVIATIMIPNIPYYIEYFGELNWSSIFYSFLIPYIIDAKFGALLYVCSLVIRIYGSKRDMIIQNVNEKAGVW